MRAWLMKPSALGLLLPETATCAWTASLMYDASPCMVLSIKCDLHLQTWPSLLCIQEQDPIS